MDGRQDRRPGGRQGEIRSCSLDAGKQGYVLGPSVYYLGVYGYADAVYSANCSLSDVVPPL